MAETLQFLSILSFIVSGICLMLAVFLGIFFKIPDVVGDLSGRNARKSIANMRTTNEKTGVKFYRESKVNLERGKLTGKMGTETPAKKEDTKTTRPETSLLSTNKADKIESEETYILKSEETGVLMDGEVVTSLLNKACRQNYRTINKKIKIIEEVMIIHTDEVLE